MPFYEYRCEDCGHTFEKFVRTMSQEFTIECPDCDSDRCKKKLSLFACCTSESTSAASAPPCAVGG